MFAEGERKNGEYYSPRLWQIFDNFYLLLCYFTILGQWEKENMLWLYIIERGKNRDILSDAYMNKGIKFLLIQ